MFGRRSNALKLMLRCLRGGEWAAQVWSVGELIQSEILGVVVDGSWGIPGLEHVSVGSGLQYQPFILRERHQVEEEVHDAMAVPYEVAHSEPNCMPTTSECGHLWLKKNLGHDKNSLETDFIYLQESGR